MKHWTRSCPYCRSVIDRGMGYMEPFLVVWVPVIRCKICGKLINTDRMEYLTMPVAERTKLPKKGAYIDAILASLDRMNNSDYYTFLRDSGFTIYPIEEADRKAYPEIRFDYSIGYHPSPAATRTLYDKGILLTEEQLDKNTGGIKQEILDKNFQKYRQESNIGFWTILFGLGVGLIFTIAFALIFENALWLLGIAFGFVTMFAVEYGMTKYYKKRDENKPDTPSDKTDKNNSPPFKS